MPPAEAQKIEVTLPRTRVRNRSSAYLAPIFDDAPNFHSRPVHLSLLGGMRISFGGREIIVKSRKAKALLAYLALTPSMKETRGRLVGLLWSESDETKAHACLRQLLHNIREVCRHEGLQGFETDQVQVGLNAVGFTTDLSQILTSINTGIPHERLINEARISETLLSGYEDIDPAFTNWVGIMRENVRLRLLRALEVQLFQESHGFMQTKHIAVTLLQLDPTHEPACRQYMSASVGMGDVAGALMAYRRLWTHLEDDYDIEPSSETQELVVAIKCGNYRPPVHSMPTTSSRRSAAASVM